MMNRFLLFGIAMTTALSLFPRLLQAEEKTQPERLATAPSGKFYLISIPAVADLGNEAGERLALVPTNDPKTPIPFPINGKVDAKTSVGFAFISPDESWILSQQNFCRTRLYFRIDELR